MKNKVNNLQIYSGARDRDKRALVCRSIWENYYPGICLFTRSFFGKKHISEDIIQEIFARAFEKLETYNPLFAFSTWIYRIARNYCINAKKRINMEQGTAGEFDENIPAHKTHSSYLQPEEAVLKKELQEDIAGFITTLEERDRQIVFFHYSENMKYRQISSVLGIPVGTVKYRIFIIKDKLKEFLEVQHAR